MGRAGLDSSRTKRGPLVAILGGVGTFVTEALTMTLTEGGSRVIGAYPNRNALQRGPKRQPR